MNKLHNADNQPGPASLGPGPEAAPSVAPQIATAEHTRRQIIWDRHLQNSTKPRRHYKETAVLLVSFEDTDLRDLDIEVDELRKVFSDLYGFHVDKRLIKSTANSQWDLTTHLATFFRDHDSKSSLLIIYYAGHGWAPPSLHKEFNIHGKSNAAISKANCVKWHEAESMLAYVKADVLAIFDCCNAGRLCHTRGPALWEVLGACSEDQRTQPPGPDSFTKALIWALEELRKEPKCRFSIAELQQKIKDAPRLPTNQQPPLANRTNDTLPHIIIAPYNKEDEADNASMMSCTEEDHIKVSQYFDIRFHADEISDALIEKTAVALSKLISPDSESHLEVERISYLGSDSVRWALVQRLANSWLGRVRAPKTPVKGLQKTTKATDKPPERPKLQISDSAPAGSAREQALSATSATSDKSLYSNATTCVGEAGQLEGKRPSSAPEKSVEQIEQASPDVIDVDTSIMVENRDIPKSPKLEEGKKRLFAEVEGSTPESPKRKVLRVRRRSVQD